MIHTVSLALTLFGAWLLWSGHYTPLLLVFGGLSCAGVVALALRMDVVDHEGHPIHFGWGIVTYIPWLVWQIIVANLDVVRRILSPSLPISPTLTTVDASQKTELGQVVYANSITLTPGTVSIDVEDGKIVVHALSAVGAADVESGDMDRRVTRLEGRD